MSTVKFITLTRRATDITGRRFGMLIALGPIHRHKGQPIWLCDCDCGKQSSVDISALLRSRVCSCGCRKGNHKHGMGRQGQQRVPEYTVWANMKGRCNNPGNNRYYSHGARGITVCERWMNSFEAFFDDMGRRPSAKHSLDRIDNDGDYLMHNCRWATQEQQQRNKRNNHLITYNGEQLCLTEWADRIGIRWNTLLARIDNGWSVERAFTQPVNRRTS